MESINPRTWLLPWLGQPSCPHCFGSGERMVLVEGDADDEDDRCPYCGGDGYDHDAALRAAWKQNQENAT